MGQELSQRYPPSPSTPQRARCDIADYLAGHDLSRIIPVATLLVSELVTNSVLHAGGPIGMRARLSPASLHVDVDDRSARLPQRCVPDRNGRGLHIIDAFATSWGVDVRDDFGKSTWFELGLT